MGLDSVLLQMETEQFFGIEIPQTLAEKIYTVGDMTDAVAAVLEITGEEVQEDRPGLCPENYKAEVRPGHIRSRHEIYVAIVGITSDFTGMPCGEIGLDTSFADDLGID